MRVSFLLNYPLAPRHRRIIAFVPGINWAEKGEFIGAVVSIFRQILFAPIGSGLRRQQYRRDEEWSH
jgi:hypothetical protein